MEQECQHISLQSFTLTKIIQFLITTLLNSLHFQWYIWNSISKRLIQKLFYLLSSLFNWSLCSGITCALILVQKEANEPSKSKKKEKQNQGIGNNLIWFKNQTKDGIGS
jgi:hypothetical protein